MSHKMSKNLMRFNYKKYKQRLRDTSDVNLKKITVEEQLLNVADILVIPISKYITLAENKCGYSGTEEELIIGYVHPLFF